MDYYNNLFSRGWVERTVYFGIFWSRAFPLQHTLWWIIQWPNNQERLNLLFRQMYIFFRFGGAFRIFSFALVFLRIGEENALGLLNDMSMFLGLQTCADVGGYRVHVRRLNIFWKFICNGVEKRTTKRSKKSYFRLFFGYKCCLSLVPGLFIFQKISWMKRSKFRWCSNNLNLVIGFFLVYLYISLDNLEEFTICRYILRTSKDQAN